MSISPRRYRDPFCRRLARVRDDFLRVRCSVASVTESIFDIAKRRVSNRTSFLKTCKINDNAYRPTTERCASETFSHTRTYTTGTLCETHGSVRRRRLLLKFTTVTCRYDLPYSSLRRRQRTRRPFLLPNHV